MISLGTALKLTNQKNHRGEPTPFSLTFVTANRSKKTGGEIITVKRAILSKYEKSLPAHLQDAGTTRTTSTGKGKNPNHFFNGTRNIIDLDTQTFIKVHIRLITHFNGQQVTWK